MTYVLYDLQCLRFLSDRCHAAAWFDDAGFFLRDLCDRVAKEGLMIHADRYENGKFCRADQVCRICDTAHAYFQDDRITFFFYKK